MSKVNIQTFPYIFQPKFGQPITAEWGYLSVPENRSSDRSRLISMPFVRFRCTSKNQGTPIIFLQGGPGESLLPNLTDFWERPMWRPNLEIADFIFIEQRGFGLSQPCLDCPGVYNVPLDKPGNSATYLEAHSKYLTKAVDFWQKQGVDLNGYNVREMAADINDLRQALGYGKVSLFGGSFGSHHGFTLLKYYDQFIDRAFLFGIEGPNHTIKLPSNVQRHLEKLNRLAQKDAKFNYRIPDLPELISSILDKLEREPATLETLHPFTNEKVKIAIGKYDLQLVTAKGLGNTEFIRSIPARYLAIAAGDYSWLAEQVIRARINQKSNLMYETTDCASGATATRRKQIELEATTTILGNAINEPFHSLCDVLGGQNLGDDFRSKLTSKTPILLVCGSLDARTPVRNAEELLPDLPSGQLLTIEGVSHDLSVHGDHIEELTQCRDRFFQGKPIKTKNLHSSFKFEPYEL